MKNHRIAKCAVTAVACAFVATASAQSSGPSGISARIGLALPTSSDISGAWVGFGVDYKLSALPVSVPMVGSLGYFGMSVDYFSHGSNSDLPLVLNYNFRTGPLVYSVGAGVNFYKLDDKAGSGTGFTTELGVSYDLGVIPLPIFLQAKYFLTSRSETRGIGVYAGIRF